MHQRLASLLALMGCALAAMAAAHAGDPACKPAEAGVLVCASAGRELRVIRETTSPSGRYAIAWGFRPGDAVLTSTERFDDGTIAADDTNAVENHIVRLGDGARLKTTRGTHFGDREDYNHRGQRTHWSADGRWLVEINNSKWETLVADVYHIDDRDRVVGPFRLFELARAAARSTMQRTTKPGQQQNLKRYVFAISAEYDSDDGSPRIFRLDNDGNLRFRLTAEVPKAIDTDTFNFALTVRVAASRNGLAGRLVAIKRIKDD